MVESKNGKQREVGETGVDSRTWISDLEVELSIAMKSLADSLQLEEQLIVAHGCLRGFGCGSDVCGSGTVIWHPGRREPGRKVLSHNSQEAESMSQCWLASSSSST